MIDPLGKLLTEIRDDPAVAGIGSLTETAPATDTASSALNGRLQRIAQRVTSLIALVPSALGSGARAGAFRVTIATDDTQILASGAVSDAAVTDPTASASIVAALKGLLTVLQRSATATRSDVSGAASSTSLLASNTARIGATITNESTATLYLLLGTGTASATNYTVAMAGASAVPYTYYEVPARYTGQIKGIWASATGSARMTELT